MTELWDIFNLDGRIFDEWAGAERHRLPACTLGFAQTLALVRMVRPSTVVWVSVGDEPESCGYDSNSVARLVADTLPMHSRLIWVKSDREVGIGPVDISYLYPLVGDGAPSGFVLVCVPGGFGGESLRGIGGGVVLIERAGTDWVARRLSSDGIAERGELSGSAGGGDTSSEEGSEHVTQRGGRRRR